MGSTEELNETLNETNVSAMNGGAIMLGDGTIDGLCIIFFLFFFRRFRFCSSFSR
jgi:hypothetical protein